MQSVSFQFLRLVEIRTITQQENWSQCVCPLSGDGVGGGDNDEAEIGSDRTRRLFADHLMTVNGFVIVRREINSESNKKVGHKVSEAVWKQQVETITEIFLMPVKVVTAGYT